MAWRNDEFQRVSEALQRHRARLGSWPRLAAAIHQANDFDEDRRIDRRTLERLCSKDAHQVSLKISQLLALDRYFAVMNEGSILVRQKSLIDSVCESHAVNLLLPVKYVVTMSADVVSRWDFAATTRLLRTRISRLQINLWDIAEPANWSENDPRMLNAAVISVGSPVANEASERLMASMTGVEPHAEPDLRRLPFYIVGTARDDDVESSFIATPQQAAMSRRGRPKDIPPGMRALVFKDNWHVSNDQEDYALLLAQRSPVNGQVRMVLCGLTGQGTFQLARILRNGEPAETLPPLREGQKHPPILVACYRMMLAPKRENSSHNEDRVISYAAVDSPCFVHHVDGDWQFLS